ncbi:MAG TPA: ribonuclease Y [Proteobacteria bacterium]|nr:ribonuclease Y [Pseudomonadota bacterium]
MLTLIVAIVVAVLAFYGGMQYRKRFAQKRLEDAEYRSKRIIEEAERKAKSMEKEAQLRIKDMELQSKAKLEEEAKEQRKELQQWERRLLQKEEHLEKKVELWDRKEEELNKRERSLVVREKAAEALERKYEAMVDEWRTKLERLAGMTAQEAKRKLLESMEEEAEREFAKRLREMEDRLREEADRKAKEIIATSIQRLATDFVSENSVTVVQLPNEEMKGRIIGREGRNIRALESITGVDLIVDDTPEAVIISAHNPIRREVARIALERLVADGRIHPARIEEVVQKVEQEVEESITKAGEQAAFDVGVHGLHPEIIKLLGRLKYRTSYGQNVLQHSIEVAWISGIMAAELGLNVKKAKRAGLLHDIGKAVDQEMEGSHALIGAELLKKYNEADEIVKTVGAHHDEMPHTSLLSVIVQAADALSSARPGARRKMLESYIKRIEDLERIATSFDGVDKCYAIQAGREIRIIVESDKMSDDEAALLAHKVAKKIEDEMVYPGQIKVIVIRESRATAYAR